MDSRITFRESRVEDAALLAADMRDADVQELQAMNGNWADMQQTLVDGIQASAGTCWSAFRGDQLLILGGAAPGPQGLLGGHGVPWMLATRAAQGCALTKSAHRYLVLMHAKYPFLANYVDARHTTSVRWLRRLGFTVAEQTMPAGPYGLPFHSFWRRA